MSLGICFSVKTIQAAIAKPNFTSNQTKPNQRHDN